MADVYNNPDGTDLSAEVITQHMITCGHAVLQINGIKAGTDLHTISNGFTQAEINAVVDRSVGHLELMKTEQWYKDDSVSRSGNETKAKHTAAITTGKNYITANS